MRKKSMCNQKFHVSSEKQTFVFVLYILKCFIAKMLTNFVVGLNAVVFVILNGESLVSRLLLMFQALVVAMENALLLPYSLFA